ncbi:MAG: beta-mannosidase [Planctomycetota bacterium]|jgi:beta-mannosidase
MPKICLDLTGKWEFKQYPLSARRMRDLDPSGWLQTSVPGSIFSSLIAAGQINQTDIDTNPEKFSWVSETPWICKKVFDAPAELLNCDRVELVFDGLDTITSIWLNNKLIGKTNNMFVPFRFDITPFLKPRKNALLVKFEPAIQYAKKLMNRYTSFAKTDLRNPYRVYVRKAQYQFGWDFCPALPGCGIWRAVRLEGNKKARITDLHIRTVDCNQRYADLKIALKLDKVTKEEVLCRLNLSCAGQATEHNLIFRSDEESQSTVIRIENPFLWWPSGYGPQNLYKFVLQLRSGDEIIDETQKEIGIRTVKLNRLPDEHGEKFQFEVNNQPVFAKGANWVPASIFAGSVTAGDYQKLLGAASKSNINMLRVWGGGYYESNKFYELCDQLGIMVWQDFMFACAYYPDRQWFLQEVKEEAAKIIRQLRNHPCMVLWCGNNEIDVMHHTGKFDKSKKFHGKTIYHQLLPQLVAELDPDTDYIPTTPLGEKDKFKTGKTLTIHQWDVWSGHQPVCQYLCRPQNIPRFVTEFGLQSLPNTETIKNFCPSEHLRIASFPIEKHNYQLDGNGRVYRYVGDLFGSAENLEHFVYLSQLTQARAIKTYVEYLRAHNVRNHGVLFWQFNDCCPAISWSAMDYSKKPKALYYYAKRFFSEVLIAIASESEPAQTTSAPALQSLNVTVINDSNQPISATLSCRLIDLFGHLLDHVVFPVAITPFSASACPKLPKAILSPACPDKSALHLVVEKNSKKIAENLFFYLPDKYIDWPEVEINKRVSQINDRQLKLRLKTNAIAKDVQIRSLVAAEFSDNFIDLIPPEEREITIDCEQPVGSIEPEIQLSSVKSVL